MSHIIFRNIDRPDPTIERFCDLMKTQVAQCPLCHKLWSEHTTAQVLACFAEDDVQIEFDIAPLTEEQVKLLKPRPE